MKHPDPIMLSRGEHIAFINRSWINEADRTSDNLIYEDVLRSVAEAVIEDEDEIERSPAYLRAAIALNFAAWAAAIVLGWEIFRP